MKELGLSDIIRRAPAINCAESHGAAIRIVRTSSECMVAPTNMDELEASGVVDAEGQVIDKSQLALIRLTYQIPRSPHCVRSRIFGGEKSFFQANFDAEKLSEPEPDKYLELYDEYIEPAPSAQCVSMELATPPTDDGEGHTSGPRFAALYVDLDGTLLKPLDPAKPQAVERELEAQNGDLVGLNRHDLDALKDFMDCGGRIGFATGRTFPQIPRRLLELKPQLPFILANGGLVQDTNGSVLVSRYLGRDAARRLVSLSAQLQGVAAVLLQSATDNFLIRISEDRIDAFLEGGQLAVTTCHGVDDRKNCSRLAAQSEALAKAMFIARAGDAAEISRDVARRLGDQFAVSTGGGTSQWTSIEINQAGADKYSAIKSVSSMARVDMNDLVVFGDGRNDAPMLSGVGVSFALSYAPAEAQNAAMATANSSGLDPVHSNQVGRIVERLMLPGCPNHSHEGVRKVTGGEAD